MSPPGTDAGSSDVDASRTRDAGSDTMTLRFRILAFAETAAARMPIEDADMAVDIDGARYEGASDAMGHIDITVPRADMISAGTVAKERYGISTELDSPAAMNGIGGESDRRDIVLSLITSPDAPVRVGISATGVPAGGRWCAGVAEYYSTCAAAGAGISGNVNADGVQTRVTGIALDSTGAVVDYDDALLTGTGADRVATIAFTGRPAVTPMTRMVTLELPTDASSIYRTGGIITMDEVRPFVAVEPGTHLMRSVVTGLTRSMDGASYAMTVTWFPPTTGDPLVWAIAAYAAPAGEAFAFRWLSTQLDLASYSLIDGPRITGRPADGVYTFAYNWTPSAGADRYVLFLVNNAGRVVWTTRTTRTMDIRLPLLPTGYDPTVSFPFEGAGGYAQVRAFTGSFPDPTGAAAGVEPYRIDGQGVLGPREPITF